MCMNCSISSCFDVPLMVVLAVYIRTMLESLEKAMLVQEMKTVRNKNAFTSSGFEDLADIIFVVEMQRVFYWVWTEILSILSLPVRKFRAQKR